MVACLSGETALARRGAVFLDCCGWEGFVGFSTNGRLSMQGQGESRGLQLAVDGHPATSACSEPGPVLRTGHSPVPGWPVGEITCF